MVYGHIIFFIIGFALLVEGSNFFVAAASRIAKKLGVSDFIIGLTLVAVGTSIPEFINSIVASLKGESNFILGNIIGSNITNIGFILGISAIISVIVIKKTMLIRDAYVMISSALIFYLFALNGSLGRAEGILLLLIYMSFIIFLVSSKKAESTYNLEDFLEYFLHFGYLTTIRKKTLERKKEREITSKEKKREMALRKGLIKDFLIIIFSGIAVVYGAKYVVAESVQFAELLGVPTEIIGLSIVALGTTLPELMVSLRGSMKGFGDLVIGNIVGSNIANILLILGVSSILRPIDIGARTLFYTAPFMIIMSLILIYFMRTEWKLSKAEGIGLLILHFAFMVSIYLIFRN